MEIASVLQFVLVASMLLSALVLLPGVVLGLWIAPALVKVLSTRMIRSIVLAISAISGMILVLR